MPTQNPTQHSDSAATGKGLGNWFEVFDIGQHTSSSGKDFAANAETLAEIVNNSNGVKSPLVVGHPKTDDPAYGWSNEYKIEGTKMLARAHDYAPEFSIAVENKHFPNRSIALKKTDKGWAVKHIGFLGAAAPAVKTLKGIEFNAAEDDLTFEFALSESEGWHLGSLLKSLATLFSKQRDHLIEKEGVETADKVLPAYTIDSLNEGGQHIQTATDDNHFSEPDKNEDATVPEFTEADMQAKDAELKAKQKEIDELKQQQKTAEFSAALAHEKTAMAKRVSEGKLLPAQTQGDALAEFMATLKTSEEATFEFSDGDGKKQSQSHYEFMCGLLDGLGQQIKTGKDDHDDPNESVSNFSEEQDPERRANAEAAEKLALEKGITFAEAYTQIIN